MVKKKPAIQPTKKLGRSHIRKRTYSEIIADLNNESDEFKRTILYKRLVMRAEMLQDAKEKENDNI